MVSILRLKVPGTAEMWRMPCWFAVTAQDNVTSLFIQHLFQVWPNKKLPAGAEELLHTLGLSSWTSTFRAHIGAHVLIISVKISGTFARTLVLLHLLAVNSRRCYFWFNSETKCHEGTKLYFCTEGKSSQDLRSNGWATDSSFLRHAQLEKENAHV